MTNPVLTAARTAAGKVRLTWPVTADGFALEGTDTLGAAWAPVGVAPTVEGDSSVVEVSADGDRRFYRLLKP